MHENNDLIRFVKTGDIISFEKLFRLYSPRLRKYAFHFLQNEEEVHDLVQDVFIHLWTKRETLDADKNIEAFVFTLLKNKCLNSLKKSFIEEKFKQRQIYLESERLYHISFSKQHTFQCMEEQLKEDLIKAMDSMPERCRTAFQLRWIEDKKQKEIAKIMNISMTMVNKHLTKGMEIARKFVKIESLLLVLFLK